MAVIPKCDEYTTSANNTECWDGSWREWQTDEAFIVESWGQGVIVGALIIMAGITIANMKKKIILHKLIFVELFLAMSHGTFCFMSFDGYGWYLSSTAALLYTSWQLHNVIAWIKIKPFLTSKASKIYIVTVALASPFVVAQIVNNFRYFNNYSDLYLRLRPYEAIFRDPWWIYTCTYLVYIIKTRYSFPLFPLIRRAPRLGIMLGSMALSIIFLVVDILASVLPYFGTVGLNPYWKLSLVFKCFCDTIILDDFKTALEKLTVNMYKSNFDATFGQRGFQEEVPAFSGKKKMWENDFGNRWPGRTYSVAKETNRGLGKELQRDSGTAREAVGRVGMIISHLPKLGSEVRDTSPGSPSASDNRHAYSELGRDGQTIFYQKDFEMHDLKSHNQAKVDSMA